MTTPAARSVTVRSLIGSVAPFAAFGVGVGMLTFLYGVVVGAYRVFPFETLWQAKEAGESLTEFFSPTEFIQRATPGKQGVTVYDRAKAFDGLTFVAAFREGAYKGQLVDMSGSVLHEWNVAFSAVWTNPPHVITQARDVDIAWHGTYLYPNGDLLLNFEDGNFPFAGGLVKIDRHSKVLWAVARNTHHDVDVLEDGTIYVAALNYRPDGLPRVPQIVGPFYEDVVLRISPRGEVREEISIIDALADSPFKGLLAPMHSDEDRMYTYDPTHLNDVEVVTPAIARSFPLFDPGDLLVSLRNIGALVAIDGKSKRAKWALVGAFVRQHDPDFVSDGTILVYDNHGGPAGMSQLLAVDPATQRIRWSYTGTKEQPFYSGIRGKQQLLPNGNVLVTDPRHARVFEITTSGQIVWEYYNSFVVEDRWVAGEVSEAERHARADLTFLKGE